ncbi:MAG TPA: class I SAM-dependent methyltransferase [Pirellulaceae bacterium]|nr:class I SAM-dependent methyltransferase [Pirellulaceae bacterium]
MHYQHAEIEGRYRGLTDSPVAVDYAGRSFDDFDLREFLTACLGRMRFAGREPRVLEYGTGTGPGACFLAARGFRVTAIDISPTAIGLARRYAAERGLAIDYAVANICDYGGQSQAFDLVIDSFCLHRIIADEARQQAMRNVRRLLKPSGYYLLGSVILRPGRDYGAERLDPATGVVYSPLASGAANFHDAVQQGGRWWYARYRLLSAARLREELEAAGFIVREQPGEGGRILCVPAG